MTPSAQNARTTYNDRHGQFAVDGNANSPWYQLVKRHLNPLRDLSGKRLLEIGCGRGDLACWLADQPQGPSEIVAADFSITAVQKGRAFAAERNLTNIKWEISDIQDIAHPDASFDTVISCETIEHVPHPRKAIGEIARVLKPGGRLLLTTPNYLGTLGLYRIYLRLRGRVYTETGQPINNFVLLPLTCAWIARAGLCVKIVDAVGHYLPWPGRPPIEFSIFNNPRFLMRWFGLHSLVVAEKP
jgi:2-polyprenyl-3-methyl-5-hydroxy-6-metoxy-1,4-benzoquinol methylase